MELRPFYYVVCAALFIHCAYGEDLVPVYMWAPRSSDLVPALGHINTDTLKEIFNEKGRKYHNFLIFAEQTLSPEDFIETSSVKQFQNLGNLTERLTYLPLAENPIEIVKSVPYRDIGEYSVNEILEAETLPLHTAVIINLNDAKEDEDRIDMLKRHDEIIVPIYRRFAEKVGNILAIYTAYQSSWVAPEVPISRHSRSLMANDDDAEKGKAPKAEPKADAVSTYLKNNNLMIYLTNDPKPSFLPSGADTPIELTGLTLSAENGSKEATVTSAENVIIKLTFEIGDGYWQLTGVVVTHNGADVILRRLHPYIPKAFSFHCISTRFSDFPEDKAVLTLPGVQMQFFEGDHADTFGDSYDCVGFTTTPIWSGLFVTFIMVLILTAGLIAMMDIKTMDRFDDPKGKTISINAAE